MVMDSGRLGKTLGAVLIAASLSGMAGCSATVDIRSTRSATVPGTIEPVGIVVLEGNTGPAYTEPLRGFLRRELARRGIPGRVSILTGAEFDEAAAMKTAARGMRGMVIITPVGGTSYYGALKQIRYDVQAFLIENREGKGGVKVWRGVVDTNSGAYEFQIHERLELFARDLIERLVQERVLKRRA